MATFANKILSLLAEISNYVYVLVAVAFLVIGAMMIYPSEKSKEKAKDAVPWVLIGAAVALSAVTLANSVTSGF
ncbi:MAG: hypothetical protein KH297_04670 [Firmicutes bacterium]|nr:hypothetical protein [Bacillota bacterium]